MVKFPVYTKDDDVLRVDQKQQSWNERTVTKMMDGTGGNWAPSFSSKIIIKAIMIDVQASAAAGGRLPYFHWDKQGIPAIGLPWIAYLGATQACPAGGTAHYTWATGLDGGNFLIAGAIPVEWHALPDFMTCQHAEGLVFVFMNGDAADVNYVKIFYLEQGD